MIKEFKYHFYLPNNFTGICKITDDNTIRYYKNGLRHREDGPAIEFSDDNKDWCYKDKCYGNDNNFTNETWIEFVENLKREEELKIFK